MNKGSPEAYETCKLLFQREQRLSRFESMKPPPPSIMVDKAKELVAKSIEEMKYLGITMDFYWNFKSHYEQEFNRQRDATEASKTCLIWMRHVQNAMKEGETLPFPPCHSANSGCSMDCQMREEADEEDSERFQNGIDLDNGETIDLMKSGKKEAQPTPLDGYNVHEETP